MSSSLAVRVLDRIEDMSRCLRLVPLPRLRETLPGVSKAELDSTLLRLERAGVLDLKVANDPCSPLVTDNGGPQQGIDLRGRRAESRGLIWFARLA